MTTHPPDEVKNLKTFAELLAWAMQLWGNSPGGELPKVRQKAKRARSSPSLTVGHIEVELNFEELANNAHAQWFLRLGLAARGGKASTLDKLDTKSPGYKNVGSTTKRWYLGQGLGADISFRAFCEGVGIPAAVEEYLAERYAGFRFIDGPPKRFESVGFNARAVRDAVAASSSYLAAHPRVERLQQNAAAQVQPATQSAQPSISHGDATLVAALSSQVKAQREAAVQILLERPEIHFENELEGRLGELLAQHAMKHGLTVEDAREWLSLAELLTVPYARSWPTERLSAMLGQLCLSAAEEGTNPGVLADRIIAAAALDKRLEEVLHHTKRIIGSSNGPQRARVQVDFLNTLGDRGSYLHDGVAISGFISWLTAASNVQNV